MFNVTMATATFLYFGFGSNLLAKRILIENPTAVRRGPAILKGYRLDFNGFAQRWGGAVATIIPDENRHVWGALWEINSTEIDNLDRQEGVLNGIYEPLQVELETPDGKIQKARSYHYIKHPPPPPPNSDISSLANVFKQIPIERRPSPEYRRIIVLGAYETGLPQDYINALEMIPHNNFEGSSGLNIISEEEMYRSGPLAVT